MGVTSQKSSELFEREGIWASSIATKLREVNRPDLSEPLESCHTRQTFCVCQSCHHPEHGLNHCDRFYCPMCTGRLAWRRRQKIEWWARQVKEPKHLVLTIRNSKTLSKTYVQKFKSCLGKFRRSKVMAPVRGGLCSLEVTNEGRGWHLHAHLLLDGPFLSGQDIARRWARIIGQDFAIVKIKDCRDQAYLGEVTKYAVKGSELSSWEGYEIECFIDAFSGVRTFGTFGTLFKDNALRQKALEALAAPGMTCDKCGNEDFWFLDENEFNWFQATGKLPWQDSH